MLYQLYESLIIGPVAGTIDGKVRGFLKNKQRLS